jgi:hypothetical protein
LLGHKFPDHDAEEMSKLYADSISMCHAQEPWDMNTDKVKVIIEAAQREQVEKRERQRQEETEARAKRIARATDGRRNTPYTEDEVRAFADGNGKVSLTDWENLWVIALGKAHYIFVDGEYKYPVETENFLNRATVDLSPVPGVDLYKFNRQGEPQLLTRTEIIERYGTVARRGLVDMTAQKSHYDRSTETFVEAGCPLRTDLQAEKIDVVEQWLDTFPERDRLLLWIAYATYLDEPLPALYLRGEKHSGKTLFAHAINRLYVKDRSLTKMEVFFESFNDAMVGSPFLVADEVLPKQLQASRGSEVFREMVQQQSRQLKRKFLKSMPMNGHFRLLLLANNDRLLPAGSGFMTEADSLAVAERLLYIDLEEGPAKFLRGLKRKERDAIIKEDLLAKHALYLRDTKPARGEGRFAVEGAMTEVTRRLDFAGLRGDVLHWIYNALTGEGVISLSEEHLPVFVEASDSSLHLGINVNVMRSKWADQLGVDNKTPPLNYLRDALNTLAHVQLRSRFHGTQKRYNIVHTRHLLEWAEWSGLSPEAVNKELVERALKQQQANDLPTFSRLKVIEGGAA